MPESFWFSLTGRTIFVSNKSIAPALDLALVSIDCPIPNLNVCWQRNSTERPAPLMKGMKYIFIDAREEGESSTVSISSESVIPWDLAGYAQPVHSWMIYERKCPSLLASPSHS